MSDSFGRVIEKTLGKLTSHGIKVSTKPKRDFILKLYGINPYGIRKENFATKPFAVNFVDAQFIDFVRDDVWYTQVKLVDSEGYDYTMVWARHDVA